MRAYRYSLGRRFRLDFARVYWNSRLQGEHEALVRDIVRDAAGRGAERARTRGVVVADAMAGVGPFAVPLTSALAPHYRDVRVVCHANDLNPASYEYLRTNARLNRCFADRLQAYNLDARQFIHKMNEEGAAVDHFIMNLPQLAPEFLDAFRGWRFRDGRGGEASDGNARGPTVHVHCFGEKARAPEEAARAERQVRRRCAAALGVDPACLSRNEFRLRVVRDVGPRKNMFRASFRLPVEVGGVGRRGPATREGGKAVLDVSAEDKKGDNVQAAAPPLSKRSRVD